MKKFYLVVILVLTSFFLPGCDWIRTQLGMMTSTELEAAKQQKQNAANMQVAKDSLKMAHIDSLAVEVKDSIGSAINNITEKVSDIISKEDYSDRYYVIMGSYKNHANSKKMVDMLTENGYKPTVFDLKNGSKMVSAASFNSQADANKELKNLLDKEFTPEDIWVYDINQKLHINQ
jgi:hypothetical protein